MAIVRVSLADRKQVAWLNAAVPGDGEKAFVERGYRVLTCSDQDLEDPSYLSGLCAVVLTQTTAKPLRVAHELKQHARRLLNYDCRVLVRSTAAGVPVITNQINELRLPSAGLPRTESEKLREWQNPDAGEPPLPHVRHVDSALEWYEIANIVTELPAGPAPNLALEIRIDDSVGNKKKFREQYRVLLQRAFWDSSILHLTALNGGHSGVEVYRACAEPTGGAVGGWPQPYFIKIGNRRKIFNEYATYEDYVDPYVPFHLGPHLIMDRCCLGATSGLIVGDYVEESESLGHCACDGRSASAIACLFDRTLLGWHRQATRVQVPLADGLLKHFPKRIDRKRLLQAKKLGAKLDLAKLRGLFMLCNSTPVLAGPIHGDLHAANVRVRSTDAIVIDFFSHKEKYPLLYDAATLEASLLVEGFSNQEKNCDQWTQSVNYRKWMQSVESLYDYPPLDNVLVLANPKSKSYWFHACVLQIRRYARQWECKADQYAGALAFALLAKAEKDPHVQGPESFRRAAAYVFAERILVKTFGQQARTQTLAS